MLTVCPHCTTKNRVPAERLTDHPVCGQCKAALLPDHPAELDQNTLNALIQSEVPVVIDFWAPWCGPCRMMAPHFEQAASQLKTVQFAKINTEAHPQSSAQFRIQGIPTLMIFRQGQIVARQSGAMAAPQILQWIQQALSQAH